jgi:glycosyltransferase involved in cell wall biosynthesis
MRREVLSSDLAASVEVRDWLEPSARDQALAEADVYVLPSLNEGLPMGMLEAMSWGTAVITTPVGGIPEVIVNETNGLLVEAGDEGALAHAMARMIEDLPLRQRIAHAARESAAQFEIGRYWTQLLPLLHRAAR